MKLRYRGYLSEAQYWRDKEMRSIAEDFYKSLYKFLKDRPNDLQFDPQNGSFAVMSNVFWNNPNVRSFAVMFTPSQNVSKDHKMRGGLGKAGNLKVLVFPTLIAPADNRYLHTRLDKNIVIHEMVHLLDKGSFKGKSTGKQRSGSTLNKSDYYSNPGEWNAYWQEGAAEFERLLKHDVFKQGKAREVFFGDGSLKQLMARTDKFWNKDFLKYMNSKTKRKFDKRLAELWKNMKDKGLL